jgi:hypothetical protein
MSGICWFQKFVSICPLCYDVNLSSQHRATQEHLQLLSHIPIVYVSHKGAHYTTLAVQMWCCVRPLLVGQLCSVI